MESAPHEGSELCDSELMFDNFRVIQPDCNASDLLFADKTPKEKRRRKKEDNDTIKLFSVISSKTVPERRVRTNVPAAYQVPEEERRKVLLRHDRPDCDGVQDYERILQQTRSIKSGVVSTEELEQPDPDPINLRVELRRRLSMRRYQDGAEPMLSATSSASTTLWAQPSSPATKRGSIRQPFSRRGIGVLGFDGDGFDELPHSAPPKASTGGVVWSRNAAQRDAVFSSSEISKTVAHALRVMSKSDNPGSRKIGSDGGAEQQRARTKPEMSTPSRPAPNPTKRPSSVASSSRPSSAVRDGAHQAHVAPYRVPTERPPDRDGRKFASEDVNRSRPQNAARLSGSVKEARGGGAGRKASYPEGKRLTEYLLDTDRAEAEPEAGMHPAEAMSSLSLLSNPPPQPSHSQRPMSRQKLPKEALDLFPEGTEDFKKQLGRDQVDFRCLFLDDEDEFTPVFPPKRKQQIKVTESEWSQLDEVLDQGFGGSTCSGRHIRSGRRRDTKRQKSGEGKEDEFDEDSGGSPRPSARISSSFASRIRNEARGQAVKEHASDSSESDDEFDVVDGFNPSEVMVIESVDEETESQEAKYIESLYDMLVQTKCASPACPSKLQDDDKRKSGGPDRSKTREDSGEASSGTTSTTSHHRPVSGVLPPRRTPSGRRPSEDSTPSEGALENGVTQPSSIERPSAPSSSVRPPIRKLGSASKNKDSIKGRREQLKGSAKVIPTSSVDEAISHCSVPTQPLAPPENMRVAGLVRPQHPSSGARRRPLVEQGSSSSSPTISSTTPSSTPTPERDDDGKGGSTSSEESSTSEDSGLSISSSPSPRDGTGSVGDHPNPTPSLCTTAAVVSAALIVSLPSGREEKSLVAGEREQNTPIASPVSADGGGKGQPQEEYPVACKKTSVSDARKKKAGAGKTGQGEAGIRKLKPVMLDDDEGKAPHTSNPSENATPVPQRTAKEARHVFTKTRPHSAPTESTVGK
eukprot:Sspe_Gene.59233::Locus_32526_Transcript_1_1_Confidence_1.000_Length_3038::g.59233::m.59233